jgi:poly-gamma-glutamate synthesis protein (capsule biosynthesis protein)
VWANGDREAALTLAAALAERGLDSNRHSEQMTALLMTGVTALTRGVALQIEAHGDPIWPARQIAGFLAAADLTHVSNEVSFMDGCLPAAEMRSFCARPAYLETLRLAGVDIVELTGNHNLDFGPRYALQSLDLYAEAGMSTFGGGRDEAQARQPLLVEHNGNRLAFLGYNQFGPDYAWADDSEPGAARFSLEAVQADLAAIASRADIVFVNVQHTETYGAVPLPEQVADFRAVADVVAAAGTGVVTGSQAHQPQAIEFRDGTSIFYGLGNLFFDQTWSEATRQGLVVRHWIYRGRLIACQLIPTIIDDNDQTRLATEQERAEILQAVFAASGW